MKTTVDIHHFLYYWSWTVKPTFTAGGWLVLWTTSLPSKQESGVQFLTQAAHHNTLDKTTNSTFAYTCGVQKLLWIKASAKCNLITYHPLNIVTLQILQSESFLSNVLIDIDCLFRHFHLLFGLFLVSERTRCFLAVFCTLILLASLAWPATALPESWSTCWTSFLANLIRLPR